MDSQVGVHVNREQRESESEERSRDCLGSESRRSVVPVSVHRVGVEGHENGKHASTNRNSSQSRHDPVDFRVAGPTKPKHSNHKNRTANDGRPQSSLGNKTSLFVLAREIFLVAPRHDSKESQNGAEPDAEKGETGFARGEVVDALEDERVGGEEKVKDTVDKGGVHRSESDDGFGKEKDHRSGQR